MYRVGRSRVTPNPAGRYAIRTNQGDREILLVEDGIAYYRVSDRIYSAPIGDAEIGQPTLVAKDELIRDVHSAFFKR